MKIETQVNMRKGIQNTEVRIQKKDYSDSCLLTPEFLCSLFLKSSSLVGDE